MKKWLMAAVVLFGVIAAVSAQDKDKTTKVVFDRYAWDFGAIREVDGDVTHTFKFRNEGQLPFVIYSVQVECGCTTPAFSREPVLPGKEGEIRVTFDPTNRPGAFEKAIRILSNNTKRTTTLVISGTVEGRPRTVQDDYPFAVGGGLRIVDKNFVVGNVPRGKATIHTLGIANGGTEPIRIAVEGSGLPACVRVEPRKRELAPGERSDLVVTFDGAAGDLWGKRNFRFVLSVDGKAMELEPIVGTVNFVEDFSGWSSAQRSRAPQASYSSYYYHFSTQPATKKLVREFKLANNGEDDLIIRYLGPSDEKRIRAEADRTVIRKGETATIRVTLDPKGVKGKLSETVTVVTNDPTAPARDLRLMATIQ